jgi:hypothetical protein
MIKDFVQDSCDITNDDYDQEKGTFTFSRMRSIRLINGKRPSGTETD